MLPRTAFSGKDGAHSGLEPSTAMNNQDGPSTYMSTGQSNLCNPSTDTPTQMSLNYVNLTTQGVGSRN